MIRRCCSWRLVLQLRRFCLALDGGERDVPKGPQGRKRRPWYNGVVELGGTGVRRILSVAFFALTLSAPALAQTRVMTEHDQTASALKCLLDHNRTDCKI